MQYDLLERGRALSKALTLYLLVFVLFVLLINLGRLLQLLYVPTTGSGSSIKSQQQQQQQASGGLQTCLRTPEPLRFCFCSSTQRSYLRLPAILMPGEARTQREGCCCLQRAVVQTHLRFCSLFGFALLATPFCGFLRGHYFQRLSLNQLAPRVGSVSNYCPTGCGPLRIKPS